MATTRTSEFERPRHGSRKFFSWAAATRLPKRLVLTLAALMVTAGAAVIPAGAAQASSGGCPIRTVAHRSVSGSDKFITCAYVYGNHQYVYYVRIWASGDKKDGSTGVNLSVGPIGVTSSTYNYMKWPNWVGCRVHAEFYGPLNSSYHELATGRSWNSEESSCDQFNTDNHQFQVRVYQSVPAGLYCGRLWWTGGGIGYTSPGQLCVQIEK